MGVRKATIITITNDATDAPCSSIESPLPNKKNVTPKNKQPNLSANDKGNPKVNNS
jgi:hypothetical protein